MGAILTVQFFFIYLQYFDMQTASTQALQERIAAARQRLRSAQVSLFESLEQASPSKPAMAGSASAAEPKSDDIFNPTPTTPSESSCSRRGAFARVTGRHASAMQHQAAIHSSLLEDSDGSHSDNDSDLGNEDSIAEGRISEQAAADENDSAGDDVDEEEEEEVEGDDGEEEEEDEAESAHGPEPEKISGPSCYAGESGSASGAGAVSGLIEAGEGLRKDVSSNGTSSRSALGGGNPANTSSMSGLPPPRELFNFAAVTPGGDDPYADPPPPRMRTGYAMLHPPPVHLADEPPLPEPLRPNPKLDELVASLMAMDADRLQNPSLSMNRVAYDAFDPIDLETNLFVRDDCLNIILPAIDAPLGEGGSVPVMGGAASASATVAAGSAGKQEGAGLVTTGSGESGAQTTHHHHATRAASAAAAAVGGSLGSGDSGRDSSRGGSSSRNMADAKLLSGAPPQRQPRLTAPLNQDSLVFESRFESGNLRRAVQVSPFEYDLILRPDLNTRGHTQWFYFGFANAQRGATYKFNILNMVKPDSLFNFGMLPLIYSAQEAAKTATGWRRRGHDVAYYQNHIKRRNGYYYTLSFKLKIQHASDVMYCAYTHPYTYTDLNRYLRNLEADPAISKRFRRRPLCETLSGNTIEMLTVTSFASDPEAINKRKGVVISARVHPGESNASFMMQGIIDYLTGPSLDAKILRDNFVFKLVPMLNADGVVVGNYRCSLAGLDLNRMWRDPSRRLTPTIYATKVMLKRLQEDRDVVLFCDLHGHSRKHNVFCYGCEPGKDVPPGPRRYAEMVFPRMLWRNSPVFSFSDCSFKISRQKEGTGRVVVRRELGIVNSFTLEATLAGPNFGRLAGTHVGPAALRGVGHAFCDTILDYFDPDPAKRDAVNDELRMLYPNGFSADGNDSEGSDGNPEEDCLEQDLNELEKEMRRKKGLLKKLAQKTRKDRKDAKAEAKIGKASGKSTKGAAAPSAAPAWRGHSNARGGGGAANGRASAPAPSSAAALATESCQAASSWAAALGQAKLKAAAAAASGATAGSKSSRSAVTPRGVLSSTSTPRTALVPSQHTLTVPCSALSVHEGSGNTSPLPSPAGSKRTPPPQPGRASSAGVAIGGVGHDASHGVAVLSYGAEPADPFAAANGPSPLQRARSGGAESGRTADAFPAFGRSGRCPRDQLDAPSGTHAVDERTSPSAIQAGRRANVERRSSADLITDDSLSSLTAEQHFIQQHHMAQQQLRQRQHMAPARPHGVTSAAASCAAGYTAMASAAHGSLAVNADGSLAWRGGGTFSTGGDGMRKAGAGGGQWEVGGLMDALGSLVSEATSHERSRRGAAVGGGVSAASHGFGAKVCGVGVRSQCADLRDASTASRAEAAAAHQLSAVAAVSSMVANSVGSPLASTLASSARAAAGSDSLHLQASGWTGGEQRGGSAGNRDAKSEARELAGRILDLQAPELGAGGAEAFRSRADAGRGAACGETNLRRRYTDAAFAASALSQPHLPRAGASMNMSVARTQMPGGRR